jgi:hypothetical protein
VGRERLLGTHDSVHSTPASREARAFARGWQQVGWWGRTLSCASCALASLPQRAAE